MDSPEHTGWKVEEGFEGNWDTGVGLEHFIQQMLILGVFEAG